MTAQYVLVLVQAGVLVYAIYLLLLTRRISRMVDAYFNELTTTN